MDARRTFIVYLTNIVGGLFGLVSLYFVGRYMDPVAYGMLGFALGYLGFVSIVGDLGLGTSHIRHVSMGRDLATCVRTFVMLKGVFLGVFLVGASLALVVWWNDRFLRDASSLYVLLVILGYFVLQIVRSVPINTLTALKRTAQTQFIVLAEHVVKLPLIIFVALLYGHVTWERVPFGSLFADIAALIGLVSPPVRSQGALLLAFAFFAAMAVSLGYALRFVRGAGFRRGPIDPVLARSYVLVALPAAIVVTLRVVFTQVDAVFVGYFLVAENVGYFFAADRLTSLILIVPTALQLTFFPVLNEVATRQGAGAVEPLARGIQRTLSLVMVLVTMFFVLFPHEIIRIFMGDPFLPAADAVRVMAVYIALLAFTTTSSYVLIALGRPKIVALAGLLAIVINVVLDIILIPESFLGVRMFGLRSAGAALASVVAQVVALAILVTAARTRRGAAQIGAPTVKHVAAALGSGALLHLFVAPWLFGDVVRVWELGAATVAGIVLYLAALVGMRELGRKDLVLMRQLLSPREMARYIRSEFR